MARTIAPRRASDSTSLCASAASVIGGHSVDDRRDRALLDHGLQGQQLVPRLPRKRARRRLAGEPTDEWRADQDRQARIAVQIAPTGPERADGGGERAARDHVEDHVVAPGQGQRVFRPVVHHVIGAQAPEELRLGPVINTGDLGAHRLGNLHGVRPDTAAGGEDEHVVAWVDAGQPHEVQGVQSPHGDGGGIREAHVPGLLDDRRSRGHGHEFAIRAQSKPGRAEYLVAHLEVGHVPAHARDLASEVGAENPATRPSYAERQAQWQPEPADREPEAAHLAVGLRGFGGAYPDEDLVVLGHRRAEVGEVQHLGWSVPCVGDGLHAVGVGPAGRRKVRLTALGVPTARSFPPITISQAAAACEEIQTAQVPDLTAPCATRHFPTASAEHRRPGGPPWSSVQFHSAAGRPAKAERGEPEEDTASARRRVSRRPTRSARASRRRRPCRPAPLPFAAFFRRGRMS